MEDYPKHERGWGPFFMSWAMMLFLFSGLLLGNILIGVIAGAFSGWLLKWIPPGRWVIDGFSQLGIFTSADELYKVGAAIGFISGFLKFSVSPKRLSSATDHPKL